MRVPRPRPRTAIVSAAAAAKIHARERREGVVSETARALREWSRAAPVSESMRVADPIHDKSKGNES